MSFQGQKPRDQRSSFGVSSTSGIRRSCEASFDGSIDDQMVWLSCNFAVIAGHFYTKDYLEPKNLHRIEDGNELYHAPN